MQQVPRESLLFVIRAFGGTASWEGEGAPFDESDESITHQVCLWFAHVLTFVLVIRLVHVHVLEEFYFMQNKQVLRVALFDTSESKPSEGKPLEHTPSRKCVKVSMILAMGVGTAHGSLGALREMPLMLCPSTQVRCWREYCQMHCSGNGCGACR